MRILRLTPALLVYTGMIPFIVSVLFIYRYDGLLDAHPSMAAGGAAEWIAMRLQLALASLLIYAAAILSFLGGIRWGLEIGENPQTPRGSVLVFSVLAPLGGWGATLFGLMVESSSKLFLGYAMMFALLLVWDIGATSLPRWFKRLRIVGSIAAMASLLSVAWLFV